VARSFLTQDGSVAVVLIPLPAQDFDPTEVAVSWKVLSSLGHEVRFATPAATPAEGDALMVTGRGLDPWSPVPGLARFVGIGRLLAADGRARAAYDELVSAPAFVHPVGWDDVRLDTFDGLLLPGGHRARACAAISRATCSENWSSPPSPTGAPSVRSATVCCSRLAARTRRPVDPSSSQADDGAHLVLEQRAWRVGRLTRFWDPGYYRTYEEEAGQPAGYMSVEQEVTRALERPEDFLDVVPGTLMRQ